MTDMGRVYDGLRRPFKGAAIPRLDRATQLAPAGRGP